MASGWSRDRWIDYARKNTGIGGYDYIIFKQDKEFILYDNTGNKIYNNLDFSKVMQVFVDNYEGKIYLPSGSYYVSKTITITEKNNIHIIGSGDSTVFIPESESAIPVFEYKGAAGFPIVNYGVSFEKFRIYNKYSIIPSSLSYLIYMDWISNTGPNGISKFEDISILGNITPSYSNSNLRGIKLYQTIGIPFTNITYRQLGWGIDILNDTSATPGLQGGQNTLINIYSLSNYLGMIIRGDTNGINIINYKDVNDKDIVNNTSLNISSAGVYNVDVINFWSEGIEGKSIYINGPKRVRFVHPVFSGGSSSTYYIYLDTTEGTPTDIKIENPVFFTSGARAWYLGGFNNLKIVNPVYSSGVTNIALTINSGTATFSGDGTKTQFTIPHGLIDEPRDGGVHVFPASADADGDYYITKDATNIYVNYNTAPASGTSNVVLWWEAEV